MTLSIETFREEFEDDVTEHTHMSPEGWVRYVYDDGIIARFYAPLRSVIMTIRSYSHQKVEIFDMFTHGSDPRYVMGNGNKKMTHHGGWEGAREEVRVMMHSRQVMHTDTSEHQVDGERISIGCTKNEFERLQEMFGFDTVNGAYEAAKAMGLMYYR